MSTEKEPDYAAIARKLAQDAFPAEKHPDLLNRNVGYYHAEIKHLRSDWETIRLLRVLPHADDCNAWDKRDIDTDAGTWEWVTNPDKCTCGLSAHLSKLLEPFTS